MPWTALHERLSTVPAIPDQLHVEIASCRAALADAVLTHTGTHLEDAAWKAMAFTDRLLFHTARPSRGGARGQGERLSATIGRRIAASWRGDWASLWVHSAEAIVCADASASDDSRLRWEIK